MSRLTLFSAAALFAAAAVLCGQSKKDGEWPTYAADLAGTRYRPLDQINASNFSKLEVAWRFKTDSIGNRPEYKLEGTPLMVNGSHLCHGRNAPRRHRARCRHRRTALGSRRA